MAGTGRKKSIPHNLEERVKRIYTLPLRGWAIGGWTCAAEITLLSR
jgi:hypothetical protein